MWQVESPTFLISAAFALFLVIAAHYFQKHWKTRFLLNHPLSWLRFGAKVKSLAEIDSRPLSELSIDKSFTKKSQNWRLYNRIQIWLRTIKRSFLDFSLYERLSLTWLTIANYCHWHGQLSWRARLQIRGAVRFFPASSILSSHRPNISSHSVLVLAQY